MKKRPPAPLPLYRPLSAGPILHHHSSLRNINTSLNNLQLHPSSLQNANKTSANTSNPDKFKVFNFFGLNFSFILVLLSLRGSQGKTTKSFIFWLILFSKFTSRIYVEFSFVQGD
jgi:hypothetical protein